MMDCLRYVVSVQLIYFEEEKRLKFSIQESKIVIFVVVYKVIPFDNRGQLKEAFNIRYLSSADRWNIDSFPSVNNTIEVIECKRKRKIN